MLARKPSPVEDTVGEAHGPPPFHRHHPFAHPPTRPPIHRNAPAGEKLVLGANGRGGLATCALRPSGIFGEYDTLLVPTTVRAFAGSSVLTICFGVRVCM